MASKTHKLKIRRNIRKRNMGKERKRALRNKGSTPAFPIHKEKSE
jgi:hypothetical protein